MKKKKGDGNLAKLARTVTICLLMVSLGLLVLSCATKKDAYAGIDQAVYGNEFKAGVDAIVKAQEGKKPIYDKRNTVSMYMDKGILEHYAGNYSQSAQDLQEAERMIEEAFTKSVSANFASFIANDNTKEYPGEDFEDIYLNVFNALNYYNQGNIEGALVEIRKLTTASGKLDMLERKYEDARKGFADSAMETLQKVGLSLNDALPQGDPVNFSNSALAQYLGALFLLAEGKEDDARLAFEGIEKAFASNQKVYYHPIPKSVAEVQSVPEGKARLNIIAFSGLSPIKEEKVFTVNWPFFMNPELHEGILKLPVIVDRQAPRTDQIVVRVNGETFELELIEDMGAVIKETYNARFANSFFKTYFRVLIKYIATDVAATAAANTRGGNLARVAAARGGKAALDATEGADIRMSRYLPNKVYVGGINLDPGSYDITVSYSTGVTRHYTVDVKANQLNLVEAISLR